MENIRFSVLIPVYNVEKYLAECVTSVLNQTFSDFELILVDDGSTDSSSEICDRFSDSRVRVFHNANHGLFYTRRFLIKQAKGEYSVFVDSDDFVDVNYLEEVNDIIEKEQCDIVSSLFKRVQNNKVKKVNPVWHKMTSFEGENKSEYEKTLLFNTVLNSLCTKVVKTSLFQSDNTGFEKLEVSTAEDLLLSVYPVFNAKKIVYAPKYWYSYRYNSDSITNTTNVRRYQSIISLREAIYNYLERKSYLDDEIRKMYYLRVCKSVIGCVKDIAGTDIAYEEKLSLFNDIASDEFYKKCSSNIKKKLLDKKTAVLYFLFSKKCYKLIVFIVKTF